MIYRTVLAVVLAIALVATALPPLADARRQRAATTLTDQLSDIERVADRLIATDDPTVGRGARRVVSLRVPPRHWTSAGVEHVTFTPARGPDAAHGRVSWHVGGGRTTSRPLSMPLRTPDSEPITLREPGRHRLVLALDGRPGSPTVVVRRLK